LSTYADTSFLVALYTPDAHSDGAAARMQQTVPPVLLTPFNQLELVNALLLRVFRKELSAGDVEAALAMFRRDLADGLFLFMTLSEAVYGKAEQIARRRTPHLGTRTLDVLHVASALELQATTFYTFDHKQAKLAKTEGLKVP
jgi:predicted nucleic acid-binding protein